MLTMSIAQEFEIDVDSLAYSYVDQAFIMLKRLEEKIRQESDVDPEDDHRLFKSNPFDDLTSRDRHHLELQLLKSLTSLGSFIFKKDMVLVVQRRDKRNFKFGKHGVIRLKAKDTVKLTQYSRKRANLMLITVAKITKLIQEDKYMTSREMFYNTRICGANQKQLNMVLDDLCCLLGCSRVHLRVLCQPKGMIYGNIKFKLKNGERYQCSSSSNEGVTIPTPKEPIIEITSDAKCIIIVEKDCVLQKIIKQEAATRFVETYQVILFTARGYPDINSRAFINKLWAHLKIPIFVLTDADPHGAEIACCYKFGCYQTASEVSYLAVPQIRWLGLLPSDVEKHPIPDSSKISLTENDINKLKSLSSRPYLERRVDWLNQLSLMREMGKKAELESIDILGDYLTRTFIPNKLRYASWL